MTEQRILLLVLITSVSNVLMQSPGTDEIQNQCPIEARVNLTGGTLDPVTGLMVQSRYVFPPESRWIENDDIFGCVCYNRSKCLPLFCPMGTSMYHQIDEDCENNTKDIVPLIYSVDGPLRSVVVNDRNVYAEFDHDFCMWMGEGLKTPKFQEKGLYVQPDGAIYVPQKNISEIYNFDISCLCHDINFSVYFPQCFFRSVVYTTFDRNVIFGISSQGVSMIVYVGLILSVPFLLITFTVYTILPEMKNIHGFTLRGYVGCLSVAYTALTVLQTTGPISDLPCLFFAFTVYFSFVASFFWLNVMCFDIWWTFGGFRSFRGSVEQYDRKKFFIYSFYAFGCSTLLTGVCMIMDLVRGITDNLIRPNFGVKSSCWFETNEAKALYFYGPIGITIISNIFFFALTAAKIIRHKKDTARNLEGKDSRRHDDNKQWFNLYLKLFVVMGINWATEITSWIYPDLEYIWPLTDLVNALQGLIIFVIFICKKNIIRLLIKRFDCKIPNFLSRDSTRGVHSSSNPTRGTSTSHSD